MSSVCNSWIAGCTFWHKHPIQLLEDRIALQLRIEAICRVRSRMPKLLCRHLYWSLVARLDHLSARRTEVLEFEPHRIPIASE
jgi:hypothetical protein